MSFTSVLREVVTAFVKTVHRKLFSQCIIYNNFQKFDRNQLKREL